MSFAPFAKQNKTTAKSEKNQKFSIKLRKTRSAQSNKARFQLAITYKDNRMRNEYWKKLTKG